MEEGAKKLLRTVVKRKLAVLGTQQRGVQAACVHQRLLDLPIFASSKTVACYLSLPSELDTIPLVQHILSDETKKLYVPHVDAESYDMRMIRVESQEDLDTFTPNKWGILQAPSESLSRRADALDETRLDLIVVPGLAFDIEGHRLGRGKGYYDRFLGKCEEVCKTQGRPHPYLVGLAFAEQMVDKVPVESHDRLLDCVLYCDV